MADQCICVSSSAPNVHILVSAVRMQHQPAPRTLLISGLVFSAWHWPDTRAALSLVSCPTFGLLLAVAKCLLTSGLCNLFSHRIPLIPAAPHLFASWGTRVVSKLNLSSFIKQSLIMTELVKTQGLHIQANKQWSILHLWYLWWLFTHNLEGWFVFVLKSLYIYFFILPIQYLSYLICDTVRYNE